MTKISFGYAWGFSTATLTQRHKCTQGQCCSTKIPEGTISIV